MRGGLSGGRSGTEVNTLIIDCASGDSRRESLDDPALLGPVDVAVRCPEYSQDLLLGIGPLHRAALPGSHRLVVCGQSELWDGPYISTMGSAGLALRGLGLELIALRGCAAQPTLLHIAVDGVRLIPLDPASPWSRCGLPALLEHVAARATHDGAWALAVGPAAAVSRFGAIGAGAPARPGKVASWAGRGGLGSVMLARHGVIALLLDGETVEPGPDPASTSEPIEFHHDPRLRAEGTLAANLAGLADRALAFNGRSVSWTRKVRQTLFTELIEGRLLSQVRGQARGPDRRSHCGESCPIACRREREGRRVDFQPYASLGPNLGIFEFDEVARVHAACDRAGFDAVELGGVLAWVLETRGGRGFEIGGFRVEEDSRANAEQALKLTQRILDGRAPELSGGLAAAARAAEPEARERALYVSNGPGGGIAPMQFWSPGALAPGTIAGRYHTYFGGDHVAVKQLGRLCAERAVQEIALDNLGLCRFQQEWAEDQLSELLRRAGGGKLDVVAHHRETARRLFERSRPRRWETARTREVVAGHLRACREAGVRDSALDGWIAAFDDDAVTAADRYWEALLEGFREGLRT